jgi:hypothetical protein
MPPYVIFKGNVIFKGKNLRQKFRDGMNKSGYIKGKGLPLHAMEAQGV